MGELREKKKEEVTELDLSNCKTGGEIDGLNEEFSALEQLDLQNASLTNIKLFPKLAQLKKLDLSGNRLSKGLEHLKDCPNLSSLSLVNNKFKDLKTPNLDLDGNEFPEPKDEFRKKVFEMLLSLLLLDGANKDGEEDNSDDEEDDDEEDGEDEEDESGDDEESDDEDGPGLSALYDNTANLDDDDDDEEEVQQRQGVKRKHDEEDGR